LSSRAIAKDLIFIQVRRFFTCGSEWQDKNFFHLRFRMTT
jgi:hypothetical protein